tara:strand:+ start:260 stop:820 length:561 start_codon:yes stop_codon:yes gene_type:complete
MNRLILILLSALLFESCTVAVPLIVSPIELAVKKKKFGPAKVYENGISHKEYMAKFSTKNIIVKKFGAPSNKDILGGMEVWYYDLGELSSSRVIHSTPSNSSITQTQSLSGNNVVATSNKTTSTTKKFIEFQFNEGEDFTQDFRSNGVDYSVRGDLTRNKNYNRSLIILRNIGIGAVCHIIYRNVK